MYNMTMNTKNMNIKEQLNKLILDTAEANAKEAISQLKESKFGDLEKSLMIVLKNLYIKGINDGAQLTLQSKPEK